MTWISQLDDAVAQGESRRMRAIVGTELADAGLRMSVDGAFRYKT
jgi:hypothetical protein